MVRIEVEVNGKKELRVVERVEIDQGNLPQLIPRLHPGETQVKTPTGGEVLIIGG